MYFNYPSEYILPNWLEESIIKTKEMIGKADEELKFGINESYKSIPFNLVTPRLIKEKLQEVRERFFKAFEKTPANNGKSDYSFWTKPENSTKFITYRSLLQDTFDFYPFSMLVKKGVSSSGKEALVLCEETPIPIFLFQTVYPLCWNAIDEKNKFSISKHPIYPLFHRYMQEPLAMAMSLSVIDKAFGDDSGARDYVINRLHSHPTNYTAGVLLYSSGIYMRWKDWRDDSDRCLGKIDTIKEWIALLSNSNETPDNEQIISLWAKLFDLTAGEIQGLKAAAKYAPIVSESNDLPTLLLGLFDYVVKNPKEFQNDKVHRSENYIAKLITRLVSKQISLDEALEQIPFISKEQLIRDFIGNVMSGWSFAQDLHDGCFRIYAPTIIAVAYNNARNKADSKPSKVDEVANKN